MAIPRTTFEKALVYVSDNLPTAAMPQIASLSFDHFGFYTRKNGILCTECGRHFAATPNGTIVSCPHCHTPLTVKASRAWRTRQERIHVLLSTVTPLDHIECDLIRTFIVYRHTRKGSPAQYSQIELAREFVRTDNPDLYLVSRSRFMGSVNLNSPLELRRPYHATGTPFAYGNCNTSANFFRCVPDALTIERTSHRLTRYGFDGNFHGWTPGTFIELLYNRPHFEQTLKMGQHELLEPVSRTPDLMPQIRIATRHHYIVPDGTLWTDCIRVMQLLGIDDHNPKHLCPPDLHQWHDHLMRLKRRHDERTRRQELLQRIKQEQAASADYLTRIARFSDLCITDGQLTIRPIPTVEAVAAEGEAMHHCVFQCGYYKRSDSLLLSARDTNGDRVETIEFSLLTGQVLQSRGVCNSSTPHHETILRLMHDNAPRILTLNQAS